jgi:hypothetical protein
MSASASSSSVATPTIASLQAEVLELNRLGNLEVAKNVAAKAALDAAHAKLAAQRVSKPKIPLPSTFDGKIGVSVVTWLDEIERQHSYYDDYFDDEEKKIDHAVGFTNVTVRTEYKQTALASAALHAPVDTWDKFVVLMTTRYQPVESAITARSQLDSATQSGSVQVYVSHILKLMTFLTDMSPADQVHQFCRGLKQSIRVEVMKAKPKTLTDAINAASGFEVYTRQFGAPTSNNSSNNSSSYRQYSHRSSGAAASTSSAMDLNNLELDLESMQLADSNSAPSRETHLLAVIQQQQENQARMEQQLNALFARGQDRRSNSSSKSGDKIPGITREVYQRCRAEGVCIRCKETGHIAKDCKKPIRLNW